MTKLTRTDPGTLAKYDPQKGIKQIAVLEMAEKHYARAKDASKLLTAIRAKLEAQAEFVAWWDEIGPGAEGKGRPSINAPDRGHFLAGKDGLPRTQIVSRWRAKLAPARFETTYEQVCARYPKLLEFETMAHVGQNTGDTEWFTPADYLEAARRVLGAIDLDPASTADANTKVKAAVFFSPKDDGLHQPWSGRVWMNPPYAQPLITLFCERLAQHVQTGEVSAAIALVNNATETGWFRTLADVASAVCFPEGRIKFWHPKKDTAAPLQGQAVLYFGLDVEAFVREFSTFGVVWLKP